ncbi:protein translocase subunit SecD [Thiotrichales bacterium 19S11-10]|nr:protein translocase subunit SecD [Thiotrichales bacterium 19S11-10]MCF6807413.1 protein translocase subunit SecD [Thiotrichales bacterium 19S9-11]MCF6811382.1 protein translocase subunit SecD [Thiotrichales bacterium 19S9-12]
MYQSRNTAPLNRFPLWKNLLVVLVTLIAIIYALPNVFGDTPSLQITPKNSNVEITSKLASQINKRLADANIIVTGDRRSDYLLQLRFNDVTDQIKAQTVLNEVYGDDFTIALHLAPNTPEWLRALGANPMSLGLDLRGGMYFVLEADIDQVVNNNLESIRGELIDQLRQKGYRADSIDIHNEVITIDFAKTSLEIVNKAEALLREHFPQAVIDEGKNDHVLTLSLSDTELNDIRNNAISQVIQVMRNRVNELGVAEASVARAGANRVVIELPGVQDAARAKQILGGTATVRFQLVDLDADLSSALKGIIPIGSGLYYSQDKVPAVLKNNVLIDGNSVVDARVGYSQQTSLPEVQVKLSGPRVSYFSEQTAKNIGKPMATVLVQTTYQKQVIDGKEKSVPKTSKEVISIANINSQLGNNFVITGLDLREAQNLALLIRSGALPTPVQIVQEQQIGPSLGSDNIEMGAISVIIALIAVMVFMAIYYRIFGVIANIALVLNLVLIVAVMSIIPGATLSLPGIAGIVLNLGMSIDGNVLIFERIREEIRNGASPHAAIHSGYKRAWSTIVDSNITTLIVAVILFAIGTGAVKGFAVTLMIGILTSMFSAVTASRAMTNLVYGKKRYIKKLSIGI